jgi:PST family polysaccharide transporter
MLVENIAGMGINDSGVRQIAEAAGTNNPERVAQTTTVLRRTSVVIGLLGTALVVAFSAQLSIMTFGNTQHAADLRLLSLAVFFQLVSYGQVALIQGLRKIADLAKLGVLGALFGTLISVPVVYVLREKGIVLSLVIVAATALITSWWYSRKIRVRSTAMSLALILQEAAALLKLGFVFMSGSMMLTAVGYLVKIILVRKIGLEANGLYQSAWTLGGLYVGFIIQAMGADFYPRLTASAQNDAECNRLVNEQARVGLLLAGPGMIATLAFAPIVISLLYSTKFAPAIGVLRWICVGTALQVVTWPMGFIVVAKGERVAYFCAEGVCDVIYSTLAWACISSFGLIGAGMAFFGHCVFHGLVYYFLVGRLSGFRWSADNMLTALVLLGLAAVVSCGFYMLPLYGAVCLGATGAVLSCIYSMRVLCSLVPWERVPNSFRYVIVRLGFGPSEQTVK